MGHLARTDAPAQTLFEIKPERGLSWAEMDTTAWQIKIFPQPQDMVETIKSAKGRDNNLRNTSLPAFEPATGQYNILAILPSLRALMIPTS